MNENLPVGIENLKSKQLKRRARLAILSGHPATKATMAGRGYNFATGERSHMSTT